MTLATYADCINRRLLVRCLLLLLLFSGTASLLRAGELSLEDLRKRAEAAKPEEKPNLYTELARRESELAYTMINNGNAGEGMAYLEESVNDAIKAGDASVLVRKRQKETEIAVRKMISRMKDLRSVVSFDDGQVIVQGMNRLEKLRTDLLGSLFTKEKK